MKTEEARLQKNRWNEDMQETVVYMTRGLYLPGRIAIDIACQIAKTWANEPGDPVPVPTPPTQVAARACDIAGALCDEFTKREWVFDIPLPQAKGSKDGTVADQDGQSPEGSVAGPQN